MDKNNSLSLDELKSLINDIQTLSKEVAERYYIVFNKFPLDYNFSNEYAVATMFNGLLLRDTTLSQESIKRSVILLISRNHELLNSCILNQVEIGRIYLKKYKAVVAPNINSDPNLHSALSIPQIGIKVTSLASRWSSNIASKIALSDLVIISNNPFSKVIIAEIATMSRRYIDLLEEYNLLNGEMAAQIAARGKHVSDILRTRLAIASLTLAISVAIFGIFWWYYGKAISSSFGL